MIDRFLGTLLGIVLTVLAVAYVKVGRHAADPAQADAFASRVRSLASLDAILDAQVLRTSASLLRHYDPIVRTSGDLEHAAASCLEPPGFLATAARAEVVGDVQRFRDAFQAKQARIEEFKSEWAVLRNSLDYFPLVAGEAAGGVRDPSLAVPLGDLQRDLLVYNLRPDGAFRARIEVSLDDLSRRGGAGPVGRSLRLAIAHARIVLDRRTLVDAVLRDLAGMPTRARAEAASLTFDRHYQRAAAATASGRLVLGLLSVAAVALAVASVAVPLRRSSLALRRERENVERLLLSAPGAVVGERYRLLRRIGEGGMGVVWSAEDGRTSRTVALKFVRGLSGATPGMRKRLLREARAAALVDHPSVVRVHEVMELTDGSPVLVMEHLEGESLGDRLERVGALPLPETARLLAEVVAAVAAAHAAGIVHRDLKPDNIFIARLPGAMEVAKVLDFGIARVDAGVTGSAPHHDSTVTESGSHHGTPSYMSPEQAFGTAEVGPASDVWALGVILYECLAGRRPFLGATAAQVFQSLAQVEERPLEAACPGVPPDIAALVRRLLARDPGARPTDLEEVGEALLRHAGGAAARDRGEAGVSPSRPRQAGGSRGS